MIRWALALTIAAVAVTVGVRTGYGEQDVDEALYRRTLHDMKSGAGYYDATRDALTAKEGHPPSSARAIRPPTLFLLLRWIPERAWRYVIGLVYVIALLAAWRLAEPYGARAAPAGTAAAGLWLLGSAPFLFLHAELWGVPFFMAGLVAAREERDVGAATLLAAATVVRELYGVALVAGLLLSRRRTPWMIALGAVLALATVHVVLARDVLSATGGQVALGNEPLSPRAVLRYLSPGDRPFSWLVGIGTLACGAVALARHVRHDAAARLLAPFAVIMIVAGVAASRAYWSVTYAVALAGLAPGAFTRATPMRAAFPPGPPPASPAPVGAPPPASPQPPAAALPEE